MRSRPSRRNMKRLSRLRNNQKNRLQNMKRISYLLAVLAAAVSVISCQKGGKPEIEFEQILYTIYQQGSVEVSVNVSESVSSELTIPLLLSGDAEKDVDYTISADYITIKAGESSGSVTIGGYIADRVQDSHPTFQRAVRLLARDEISCSNLP